MKISATVLFLALTQNADAFSAPAAGQQTAKFAPWTGDGPPPADREMPTPYGNVAPPRVAGAYNQQATGNWWDRRQEINSHSDIKTSNGFPTYTEMNKGPAVPETERRSGKWWDAPGDINTHGDIRTSAGFTTYTDTNKGPTIPETERRSGKWWDAPGDINCHGDINVSAGFTTYTDTQQGPHKPKIDGPNPVRVSGAYNQQATGNWWDRRQEINSHSDINTSAGFPTYTDMNKGPAIPETERRSGKWWDAPGDVRSHSDIRTSAGFPTYTDTQQGPHKPKIDGPNPVRVSGAYNQQATGNWWDRRQEINSHSDIKTSNGFPTYTDVMREQSQ